MLNQVERKLDLNESSLEICSWARSSAWLERSTDNRKVMSSNLIGPTAHHGIKVRMEIKNIQ